MFSIYTVSYNGVWQNVFIYCLLLVQWGNGMAKCSVDTVCLLQWDMAKCSAYTFSFFSSGVWQSIQYTLSLSCPLGYAKSSVYSFSFLSIGVWQSIQCAFSLSCPMGYGKVFSVHFLFLVQWGMAKPSVYTFSFLSIGVWQNIQCAFSLSCPMGYGKMFFDQPNHVRVDVTLALSVHPELERNNS